MFFTVSNLKPGQRLEASGKLHEQAWLRQAFETMDLKLKDFNFEISVEKKGDFVEVEGSFNGAADIPCVRCLDLFEVPFKQRFRLFLYSEDGTYAGDGGEHELKDTDMEFGFFHGDKIDVAEILREQLILVLPDYPVCKADCGGICNCENKENPNKSCPCGQNDRKNPFGELKNLKLKK
ncbi:MAG TPA: DUF177 domain-containing protein [bacterium]|nr:DUF177 domain-containing protein [bacterium]